MPMRCVLVGNYGIANLGDEALRDYFLETYPDCNWTVLSAHPSHPADIPRLPGGVRSLLFTPWWKTIRAIRRSDAVVFGGGSLFTDVESRYACLLWALHVLIARICGTPVLLAFQGMGPYRSLTGEWLARWAARQACFLSVRDPASAQRVAGWGLGINVVHTFDPVFSHMYNKNPATNPKNVFVVIPRHNSGATFREATQQLIAATPSVDEVRIVLMQPDDRREIAFAESLHAALPLPASIIPAHTLDELMEQAAGARHVLSQRFHGALAALACGAPLTVLPQGEGDKLWELKTFEGERPDTHALLQAVAAGEQALRAAFPH